MRRGYTIPPQDGLRCLRRQPGYLYLDQATVPECNKHGVDLQPVRDFEGLTLKHSSDVLACPWCFRSDDGSVDTSDVTAAIGEQWAEYGEYFVEANPPDLNTTSPTFEVRSAMSSAQSTDSDRKHKVINLYGGQIKAYQTAREAILSGCDGDMTEGEVVKELARGYVGDTVPEEIAGMVNDHASNYEGIPEFPYSILTKMDNKSIRKMAAEAETDSISGRDTRLEWYSFFGKVGEYG